MVRWSSTMKHKSLKCWTLIGFSGDIGLYWAPGQKSSWRSVLSTHLGALPLLPVLPELCYRPLLNPTLSSINPLNRRLNFSGSGQSQVSLESWKPLPGSQTVEIFGSYSFHGSSGRLPWPWEANVITGPSHSLVTNIYLALRHTLPGTTTNKNTRPLGTSFSIHFITIADT